jgi:hypothetical protein
MEGSGRSGLFGEFRGRRTGMPTIVPHIISPRHSIEARARGPLMTRDLSHASSASGGNLRLQDGATTQCP